MKQINYFERLETVRFYAVFSVIFAHIFQIWTWLPNTVLLFPIGNTGVIVFFVLSGFLIGKILLSEPKDTPLALSFKNFYGRRTLRIFPIYYLYLSLAFAFNLDNIQQAGIYPWLYLSNVYMFSENTWLKANSHLWTLSIEEQFYIIWPFLVLLLRDKINILIALFLGIILLAISSRIYLFVNGYGISPQMKIFTLANFDGLSFGALLAVFYLHYQHLIKKLALPMIVIGTVGYYGMTWLKFDFGLDLLFWSLGKFMVVVFSGGVVLYALFSENKRHIFHNSITIHLGKISYGLYLYHNIIVAYYEEIAHFLFIPTNDSIVTKIFLSLLFTITIAQISFMLIEKPLLKLKQRFFHKAQTT
ncbi:MAG: acyltransferase [Methylococcales symbiont of Hymedesmia sp. n. MRB-2018]|nr:MAG: acyltransferase [Methylococcales symbiont of Hymedesmia sp. n. MRB-2018]KAF3984773.1 MAG: acyltransferase [Methylococcales symbiont of Hymedesmia sp. n. MRB-2018]